MTGEQSTPAKLRNAKISMPEFGFMVANPTLHSKANRTYPVISCIGKYYSP